MKIRQNDEETLLWLSIKDNFRKERLYSINPRSFSFLIRSQWFHNHTARVYVVDWKTRCCWCCFYSYPTQLVLFKAPRCPWKCNNVWKDKLSLLFFIHSDVDWSLRHAFLSRQVLLFYCSTRHTWLHIAQSWQSCRIL